MSTTLVRSLIAGSFSAVASLATLGATGTAHADGPCPEGTTAVEVAFVTVCVPDPTSGIPPISIPPLLPSVTIPDFDLPLVCTPLNLSNLDLRMAQTAPTNWQWRFWINGTTTSLCDGTFWVTMQDDSDGSAETHFVTVAQILDANVIGDDYVESFDVPCDYSTDVSFQSASAPIISAYDGDRPCPPPVSVDPSTTVPGIEIPTLPDPSTTVPATPDPTTTVPETPTTTVPVTTPPTEPTPPKPESHPPTEPKLPKTGTDTTTYAAVGALTLLGLGLTLFTLGQQRRRRSS